MIKKCRYIFAFVLFLYFWCPNYVFAELCAGGIELEDCSVIADGTTESDEEEHDVNQYTSYNCNDTGSCFSGEGLQITILKYSGPGSTPTTVGKPILIYQSSLFRTIVVHKSVSMPKNYNDFISKYWGFGQHLGNVNSPYDDYLSGTAPPGGEDDNPNLNADNVYGGDMMWYRWQMENGTCDAQPKVDGQKSKWTKDVGYAYQIMKYSSDDMIITYRGSDIANLGDYYKTYEDDNLTASNNYLENVIVPNYFKDVQTIRDKFGITIDYSEIDKYYVSVESVQRVLGGVKEITGSYLVKTIENLRREKDDVTDGSWESYKIKDEYNCRDSCVEREKGTNKCLDYDEVCDVRYLTRYRLTRYHHCGVKNLHKIFGKLADGYSYIKTSRSLISTSQTSDVYLNKLQDLCSVNAKCITEIDNVTCKKDASGNYMFEYYVGPTLEKALVGTTSNNKYQLVGGCSNYPSGTTAVGVKHYFLEDIISCKNVCASYISDKRSDEYLKCAENYCDAQIDFDIKGNARLAKKKCILSCGYSYGKSPVDGSTTALDRESVNSCNNANPYRNLANRDIPVKVDSTCGVDNNTGKNTEEINGLIVNCDGDKITDFDGDDTNDRIFDQRGYINIACRETSAFGFLDLTNKRLVPGQGIDYWSRLTGEKECTAFFDLEQWKFDYATISSQDPDRRKRLLYIYDVFNNELNDLYNKETNGYYDSDFAAEGDGEINWNKYEYKTDKVSVVARVKEIIDNIIPNETTLERYELGIEDKDNSVNATIVGKEEVKEIYNMNVKTKPVNKYVQTSRVNAYYKFGKYCVSKDGLATVTPAPENGVCDIVDGRKDFGKNLYYTDLNATEDENFSEEVKKNNGRHEVLTEVTVGREVVNEGTYYEDGENCPYKIDGKGVSCTVVISSLDGTIMHGNSIYVYGGVRAKLKIDEKLGTESIVSNYGIVRGKTALLNGLKETVITISDKKLGVEKIPITGIVETSKGYSVMCDREIHIIDPHDDCGVSCSVEKYEGNDVLYEIISPEPGNVSQTQVPKNYYTALSTNMNWVKVLSNTAGKYLVRLSAPLGNKIVEDETEYDETILYGKVEGTMKTSGAQCFNVCWTEPPELPNCEKSYKPVDTNEIKDHCEKYWNKDVNDYESVDDCIFQCSNACPDDRRDYELVEHYCRNNYEDLGFEKASSCVNYCYYCPECSSDYIFRQVNNYNPFPRSEDSNTLGFNYATGDRVIGSNWVGKSQYIKADDDDTSSVTGINKNQKVEYVIELTPNDVRAIREDTEKYNEERKGNDAYLDYVYMKNVDTNKRYYSKFINETFYYTFTMVNGEVAN